MGRTQLVALHVQPPVAPGGQPAIGFLPQWLTAVGANFQVEVGTASAFVNNAANPSPRKAIQIMAHLDTGANPTAISPIVAQHLGLVQTGVAPGQTAGGPILNPTYAVDILFVGTTLTSKIDHAVGSCVLPVQHGCTPSQPYGPKELWDTHRTRHHDGLARHVGRSEC
jgi:hypothetical protein